jgi:hypothetical protein
VVVSGGDDGVGDSPLVSVARGGGWWGGWWMWWR